MRDSSIIASLVDWYETTHPEASLRQVRDFELDVALVFDSADETETKDPPLNSGGSGFTSPMQDSRVASE